eukprot:SAG11_NODE_24774_length_368_cov_0.925651_2_plen_20_part_01
MLVNSLNWFEHPAPALAPAP